MREVSACVPSGRAVLSDNGARQYFFSFIISPCHQLQIGCCDLISVSLIQNNACRQRARHIKFLRYSDVLLVPRLKALAANLFKIAQTSPSHIVLFKTKNLSCNPKN